MLRRLRLSRCLHPLPATQPHAPATSAGRLFRTSCRLFFRDPTQSRQLIAHSQNIPPNPARAHGSHAHSVLSRPPRRPTPSGRSQRPSSPSPVRRLPTTHSASPIQSVYQCCHFGCRRPCLAALGVAVILFPVEGFTLFPIPRRRASIPCAVVVGTYDWQSTPASSGGCHRCTWVGRTSNTIICGLCGHARKRYIWALAVLMWAQECTNGMVILFLL